MKRGIERARGRRYLLRAAPAGTLLAVIACQDLPTSTGTNSKPGVTAQPTSRAELQRTGQVGFVCTLGRRTPNVSGPWQTREDTIYFAPADLSAESRTIEYKLRRVGSGGERIFTADCEVPFTESALRRVDRRFNIEKGGGGDQFKAREGDASTQGCVRDGMCELEPIVVEPPPPAEDDDDVIGCDPSRQSCGDGGGGGWGGTGGGGGSGGGGGFSPAAAPGDDDAESALPPDCGAPRDDKEAAWCNGSVPAGELLTRIRNAANRIRSRGATCSALATRIDEMLAAGNLKVIDAQFSDWAAAAPRPGDWAIFTTGTVVGVSDTELDWVLSHEMDHSLDHTYPGTVTDGRGHKLNANGTVDLYHTANSKTCANIST